MIRGCIPLVKGEGTECQGGCSIGCAIQHCHSEHSFSFRTFFCHSERSEESRVHPRRRIQWVFSRSFTPLRSVLDDNGKKAFRSE